MTTRRQAAPLVASLALAAAGLCGIGPALAQEDDAPGVVRAGSRRSAEERREMLDLGREKRRRLEAPRATERGIFEGTWARVAPGERHAVAFRRAADGRGWELRLYWRTPDGFEIDTAWKDHVDYVYRGHPGSLEVEIDHERSSDDRIVARYLRVATGARGSRLEESGEVVIHRSGVFGRNLVWLQEPLVQRLSVDHALYPDEEDRVIEDRRIWIFDKQAERPLHWDDVYW